ncbi:MAG: dihydroorotate dehydrogenase-like protein [Salinivirgaceae bacterium]|jgi:dihydroorotate dehydrogenase (fumarate)|nr:dihydroorotate dehydrogenase-like protein [Salinivirgaceae bacterium]
MAKLTTNYMGLELKNPIIIGASNLTTKAENAKKLEEAGAGALVYKSLFEEELELDALKLSQELDEYNERHAEMINLFPSVEHAGPDEYISDLEEVVKAVNIPVFASINAIKKTIWVEYGKKIAETGVAGIELNLYHVPTDMESTATEVEDQQIEIVKALKSNLNIPIAVKISPYYSNVLNFIQKLDEAGADAIVMFNRLFQPEINIETETNEYPDNLSNSDDKKLAIRFAALSYGNIKAQIIATNGIHYGTDAIKVILAGADAVQIVSTVYNSGFAAIKNMVKDLESWMNRKEYNTIDEFKGKLSRKKSKDPYAYRRAQYIDILLNSEEIFKFNPQR